MNILYVIYEISNAFHIVFSQQNFVRFNNANILHYDLFFPDGSCPPRHILLKFLQISEEVDGAVAVHCKVTNLFILVL